MILLFMKFCEPFCDPTRSPPGICPPTCFSLCNSSCVAPNFLFPPPQPPDFAGGYSIPAPNHTSKLSLFLIIGLAILVTCFFLFSCYTIYKFFNLNRYVISRRRREPRPREEEESGRADFLDAQHGPVVDHYLWYIRTVGLEPSVISKIAIVKYNKGDGLVEGTDCSVCLNEFQEDETLRLLPNCSHAFHIPCIDTWLNSHTNCPVCRAGIVNNTAIVSEEPVVRNSGLAEEAGPAGVGRGSEDQDSELRIRIGDDNESRDVNESKFDEIQPIRRSVSMDYSSALIIDAISITFSGQSNRDSDQESVERKDSDNEIVDQRLMKLVGNSTVGSLQTGSSSSITRSLSCSARLFLSRYACGTRDSVIHR